MRRSWKGESRARAIGQRSSRWEGAAQEGPMRLLKEQGEVGCAESTAGREEGAAGAGLLCPLAPVRGLLWS